MAVTRSMAAAARRPWNDTVLEILVLVVELLPCVIDRDCFTATCRRWRSAAKLAKKQPVQLPWVVLRSPGAAATTVFSILSGSRRRIHLPRDLVGARLCGSHPGGWLAVAGHVPTCGNAVVNHMSGEIVPLPDKLRVFLGGVRQRQMVGTDLQQDVDIRAIAFSAAPNSPYCQVAAITGGRHSGLAVNFHNPGAEDAWRWTSSERILDRGNIEDIVFFPFMGFFHAITSKENLLAAFMGLFCVEFLKHKMQRQADEVLDALPDSIHVVRYLVESRGALLMVRRYYSCSRSDGLLKTLFFRVFQWQTEEMMETSRSSWLELDGLDGRVLFLARGSSRCFELPNNSGIHEGSIYFLDDTNKLDGSENDSHHQDNTDMGVYCMGQPGLSPTMCPDKESPIYGTGNFVVFIKLEGKMEVKLFENRQELNAYVWGQAS